MTTGKTAGRRDLDVTRLCGTYPVGLTGAVPTAPLNALIAAIGAAAQDGTSTYLTVDRRVAAVIAPAVRD